MMISKNYDVRELVPPEIWAAFGEKSIRFGRTNVVEFLEWLSDYLNVHVVVNDWHKGGHYKNSGFRLPDCLEGAKLSQHKFMNAIDCKAEGFDAETLRGIIRENFQALHDRFGVTTIEEDTPGWLHVDFRWTGMSILLEVPFK